MFHPEHIKDGVVQHTAVSLDDLKMRGFSVNRGQHVTRGIIQSGIDEFLGRDARREFVGIACFKASTIREFRSNGSQEFVVIDAAESENTGHAAIYAANPSIPNSKARQLRSLLSPLLSSTVSLEQALGM